MQSSANNCKLCHKQGNNLLKCSGCSDIFYCGIECQRKDWKEHKVICGYIKKQEQQQQQQQSQESEKNNINDKISKQGENTPEQSRVDDFERIEKAGEGNFTEIWLVKSKDEEQKKYALKIVEKQKVQRLRKQNDILMEKHCLLKLKECEYVIRLHETFRDEINVYLLMEYIEGGELWSQIKNCGLINQDITQYFICHLLKGIREIHSQGIVHRDLKPENILVTKDKKIKLIDFGTARDLHDPSIKGSGNSSNGKRVYEHFIGTPQYMSPECFHNKESNQKSDVWSLGCILYQMIAGLTPFVGGSDYIIFTKADQFDPIFYDYLFDEKSKDLISKMLTKDYEKRISLEEVMKHEYFNGIDFNNLPSFEQCLSRVQTHEMLIIELREAIFTLEHPAEDASKEKKEEVRFKIEEGVKIILQKLQNQSSNMKNEIIEYTKKRIELAKEICLWQYGFQEFEWKGMPQLDLKF